MLASGMTRAEAEAGRQYPEAVSDLIVDRLAMLLLQQMLSELARTYRMEGATAARLMLADIEEEIAERLYLMCDVSPLIRNSREVIRAVALRVRAELRGQHV
ncbi:hypothetical protein MOX02_45050 [Methylobacterium oxalidis]|uniref:Uncharacterized protein n=1 Tax=Methylobacterium oxalidis TaxID=944322 RepID=A0A512J921_9HYPH|nr:hypothetical protein MOX02_45050 [Methylobacterium oxalidis]GJE33509.1 hypothetical protein LDDCCGHA_3709 [Methylobacterium oxalidis]GLS65507.1 hypothetical protein GCM10007888_38890 [Methylobacterium oxalidis]